MYLYFLRHGIAEDPEPGRADSERHLTPEGVERMRLEAAGMQQLGLQFTHAYTSPYARARETALLVQEGLGLATLEERPALASGVFGLGALQPMVRGLGPNAHVLLVGHEPDMSLLVGLLTGARVEMKKGSLACVQVGHPEPDAGSLVWLLPPRFLAELGATSQNGERS